METKKSKFGTLGAKILILLGLLIASSIPRWLTQNTIEERQAYQNQAIKSVVDGWASRQKLGLINFNIPYTYTYTTKIDKKTVVETGEDTHTLAPTKLVLHVSDVVEYRKRGIYEVPVYTSDVVMEGTIMIPKDLATHSGLEIPKPKEQRLYIDFESASAVSDLVVEVDGKVFPTKNFKNSYYVEFNETTWKLESKFSFKVKAKLRGTEGIDFSSYSEDFEVFLNSSWPHPSFVKKLPFDHKVTKTGFNAHWKMSSSTSETSFGVNYIEPVNVYSQTLRATKYGFLICLLTLSVLFLIEILAKFVIHPMQYILMTLPLSVFYILLIAFAEYVGFAWAYLIASSAIVLLLLIYFKGIGAEIKQCFGFGTVLISLYSLIYLMLSSEDSALLIGSISLFGCLAAFMWLTRKLDWRADKQLLE